MSRPSWAPPGLDLSRPSAARVYDYYLGGSHNFEVDRRMAEEAIRLWPELPRMMQANRDFMRRAVRYLVGQGITQFIDIGSGIPTAGNVHEVAQRENPQTNVVYVDNDPVAVAHSRAILADVTGTTVVEADFRNPGVIFDDPAVRELIDFNRPVALLLVAVLHFVPDADDPYAAVRLCCDMLASGSYLVISHASSDGQRDVGGSHQQLYKRTPTPMTMRTGPQIEGFFGGLELVSPGLVPMPLWRPEDETVSGQDQRMAGYAGVGQKA
jgi:hypothetical protein